MRSSSVLLASGNVAQTGTSRNNYYCGVQCGGGENNATAHCAVQARILERTIGQPSWAVRVVLQKGIYDDYKNVRNNGVITISLHPQGV